MDAITGSGGWVTEVDPGALTAIAGVLDDAGAALLGHASALQVAPDASASTELVANAVQILATTVAGFSGHIGDLAVSTGTASASYVTTDEDLSCGFRAIAP